LLVPDNVLKLVCPSNNRYNSNILVGVNLFLKSFSKFDKPRENLVVEI
jgi:hypothetical protein